MPRLPSSAAAAHARRLLGATAASLMLLAAGPSLAAGQVQVNWEQPERFVDAGRSIIDRERTLAALGQHLQRLGARLPDGQTLEIAVTDLNLAGEIHPFSWHEVRVLRGRADWPTMSLRYTLREGNRSIRQGQADLSDMGYFFSTRSDHLGYEKRMIDRWFAEAFASH